MIIACATWADLGGAIKCDDKQILQVATSFVSYLKHHKLKPIWACVDSPTEKALLEGLGWRCVAAVAEQRLDPTHMEGTEAEKSLQAKVRRAEREGVKVTAVEGELNEEMKDEIRARIKDWQSHRHGTQVYSAGLRPFDDPAHRHYFIGRDKDGKLCALVVLAQLAKERK